MTVVEGLFSCPPVHYVLDWGRFVSTLVQEDKEEWWPVMCRKLVSDSFQTISKYFVQVLCCQFVQLGDSEDWWRGMYLLCKVFIYAAFHQFPSTSKRTWSLPISCRWPTWSLLISYPNLLVGHLLAISENIPRLVHPIFYAEWVAVMMILISECCHNEFGCRSRLSPKPFFQQPTR